MSRFLVTIFCAVFGCVTAGLPAQAFDALTISTGITSKWQSIQARMAQDAARLAACRADAEACSIADKRLETIIDFSRVREGRARIGEINRAVNLAIRPISDLRRFGTADRWSSPLETLHAGSGDCEDYVILKFMALREAGISADDLQFLIVQDTVARVDHAILTVRLADRWLVLDNRGFALVDLQYVLKRYRILAQLSPEQAPAMRVSADAAFRLM